MTPFSSLVRIDRRVAGLLLYSLCAWLVVPASLPGDEPKPVKGTPAADGSKPGVKPGTFEVRVKDGSILKVTLPDDKVVLSSAYGKLAVPVADVQKIEFATRLSDEVARKIQACITSLGSSEFKEREQASADLLKLKAAAYPALVDAAKSKDPEVKRRAEALIARIKAAVPEESLRFRKHDVLYTKEIKVSGKIENATLKVDAGPLGTVEMKVADMRLLRSLSAVASETENLTVLPDPGSLDQYASQFGTKLAFRVTGQPNGSLWGTGVYTLDSTLATAAVHAGVLQPGQTGVVKVEIVAPLPAFAGSTQNGVSSGGWGAFPSGAFQFIKEPKED